MRDIERISVVCRLVGASAIAAAVQEYMFAMEGLLSFLLSNDYFAHGLTHWKIESLDMDSSLNPLGDCIFAVGFILTKGKTQLLPPRCSCCVLKWLCLKVANWDVNALYFLHIANEVATWECVKTLDETLSASFCYNNFDWYDLLWPWRHFSHVVTLILNSFRRLEAMYRRNISFDYNWESVTLQRSPTDPDVFGGFAGT